MATTWRAVGLVSSLLFGVFSARTVFADTGNRYFGGVMTLATLQLVLPFSDLGLGSIVMTAIAQDKDTDGQRQIVTLVRRVLKALLTVGGGFCLLGVSVASFNIAPKISPSAYTHMPGLSIGLGLFLLFFGASVPLGIFQRILIAFHRTHIVYALGAVGPPVTLAIIVCMHLNNVPVAVYGAAWPMGNIVSLTAAALYSKRDFSRQFGEFPWPWQPMSYPQQQIGSDSGWHGILAFSLPTLVVQIVTPLGLQADRILLAVASTPLNVTQYSLAAQVYAPAYSLILAAATPLWPKYVTLRESGRPILPTLNRNLATSGLLGTLLAIICIPFAPIYSSLVTGSGDSIPWSVVFAMGVLIVTQSIYAPLSMFMNFPAGLRLEATVTIVGTGVNIALTLYLSSQLGSSGPFIGSITAIAAIQILGSYLYVYRFQRKGSTG